MKKIRWFAALMILSTASSFGQTKRFELSLFGGASHVFAYGAAGDYAVGSNDFPVTPAHTPAAFGAAFAFHASDRLGIELRGDYTSTSSLSLSDPSDGDTVSIRSAKHLAASLNLLWKPFGGSIRPYVVLGGGLDKLQSDAVTVQSRLGYDVTFLPPDKTVSFFANAGLGLRLPVSTVLEVQADFRYRLIFSTPHSVSGLFAAAGMGWRF